MVLLDWWKVVNHELLWIQHDTDAAQRRLLPHFNTRVVVVRQVVDKLQSLKRVHPFMKTLQQHFVVA